MIFNSLRVYITEQCNANCNSCFNKGSRSSSKMDVQHFTEICKFFSNCGINRIKIMGGEPTVHPQFHTLIDIAQQYFRNVFIFTNAINDGVLSLNMRETDSIVYNYTFHKMWTFDKLLLNKPGKRAFEIQIKESTDIQEIISYLSAVNNYKITSVITLDCTSNIFKNRALLIKKIQELQSFFEYKKFPMSMDHRIPLCFLYKSEIKVPIDDFSLCSTKCSCLIDANYYLRFCNQSSKQLVNIFQNNAIIPIQLIENALLQEFYLRQYENINLICHDCVFYNNSCNGGCFLNNTKISKESIIDATEFPIQ